MTTNQDSNQLADQAGATGGTQGGTQAGNQNQGAGNFGHGSQQGTTSITGSQITNAGDSEYLPTGNSAIQGAMSITGSITDMTPDRNAGGPHPTGGVNPRT